MQHHAFLRLPFALLGVGSDVRPLFFPPAPPTPALLLDLCGGAAAPFFLLFDLDAALPTLAPLSCCREGAPERLTAAVGCKRGCDGHVYTNCDHEAVHLLRFGGWFARWLVLFFIFRRTFTAGA